MQPVGQPPRITHEARRRRILADADQHALARGPGAADRVGAHVGEHLLVDALRRAAQRELAQGGQVAGLEVIPQRALGLGGDIDFALAQPLDQVVGRKVDHLDIIGAIENAVRHGLPDADVGNLGNNVVEALDVLDVDRRVDVDTGGEQLLDIEIALGMAAALDIGMRQLVDEHERRAALQDGIEVHLLERVVAIVDTATRHNFQAGNQRLGLGALMGLDDTDDDIGAFGARGLRRGQHLVRLADAGRGAEEDLQPPLLLSLRLAEQRFGRWTLVAIRRLGARHCGPCATASLRGGRYCGDRASKARLSFRTFTTGSPRIPSERGSV